MDDGLDYVVQPNDRDQYVFVRARDRFEALKLFQESGVREMFLKSSAPQQVLENIGTGAEDNSDSRGTVHIYRLQDGEMTRNPPPEVDLVETVYFDVKLEDAMRR
ncbi:hypothetical protein LLE49_26910 [Alicyclobacillus tolerans]|uniref:hypothetical protein n=1 Tax=Alicyclobacillus tolerans TaxID=90970 RepID=UPI001F2A46B1|nr:hypothetical protein [Alicyclobacillus tolerans]MCF8568355.1 hypothetical protein [Alicyclobacillus tolerans]